jgi:hypothetical protein
VRNVAYFRQRSSVSILITWRSFLSKRAADEMGVDGESSYCRPTRASVLKQMPGAPAAPLSTGVSVVGVSVGATPCGRAGGECATHTTPLC